MTNSNNSNNNSSSNNRTFGVEFELFFTRNNWNQFVYDNRDILAKEVLENYVPDEDVEIFKKTMSSGTPKQVENEIDMHISDPYEILELIFYKKLKFPKSWELTSDSSIRGGSTEVLSIEIVTPPLSIASGGLESIARFCQAFKPYASVNKTTGLHVHVDANEFIKKSEQKNLSHRLLIALMSYKSVEPLFDQLVTANRRANKAHYAQATPKEEELYMAYRNAIMQDSKRLDQYISAFQYERYNKLNLHSLEKHGTLEFRQMHGTLNEKLIIGWIKLAINFIEQVLKTDAELRSYFAEQQKLIKKQYAQGKKEIETSLLSPVASGPNNKARTPAGATTDTIIRDMIVHDDYYLFLRATTGGKYDADLVQKAERIVKAMKSGGVDSKAAVDYLKKLIAANQKKLVPTSMYNQAKRAYQQSPLTEREKEQEQDNSNE